LLDLSAVEGRLGGLTTQLVHGVLRVRAAPDMVEVFDDESTSALRDMCLAFHDARAVAIEVIARALALQVVSLPILMASCERQGPPVYGAWRANRRLAVVVTRISACMPGLQTTLVGASK
jgi:hypothetical protein